MATDIADYLLEEDKLIGHELALNKKCIFGRRLGLTDVYYNDLMKEITSDIPGKIASYTYSALYLAISRALETQEELNFINTFSFRNGGNIRGISALKKRINNLNYNFVRSYVERAKEILKKQRKSRLRK